MFLAKESIFISPTSETLKITGDLYYGESNRAWSIIRLKHDLLREFPQLKERREKFDYKMIMHRSFEDLKKDIKEIEEKGGVVPILLFFRRKQKDI